MQREDVHPHFDPALIDSGHQRGEETAGLHVLRYEVEVVEDVES